MVEEGIEPGTREGPLSPRPVQSSVTSLQGRGYGVAQRETSLVGGDLKRLWRQSRAAARAVSARSMSSPAVRAWAG